MEAYNLDKLIKVTCKDFVKSNRYSYKNKISFMGFVIQKEGVYDNFFNTNYFGINPPKNYILNNFNDVFVNPKVILYYEGEFEKVYYFNTYKEALLFYNEITMYGQWNKDN